jgi:hypothetical protein
MTMWTPQEAPDYAASGQARVMQVTGEKTVHALTRALADEYSRRILISASAKAKTVEDFSGENDIPLSTCYRRVHEMHQDGILLVERIVISSEGKKSELYRSGFKGISIKMEDGKVSIEATVNEDVADKLYGMWSAMRWKE